MKVFFQVPGQADEVSGGLFDLKHGIFLPSSSEGMMVDLGLAFPVEFELFSDLMGDFDHELLVEVELSA